VMASLRMDRLSARSDMSTYSGGGRVGAVPDAEAE
jgi:hypothetical protein